MAVETASEDFVGTERFQVLRHLGKGGMGVVYEAIDLERNEHVALKTLKRLSANAVLRFKNEFRALQDLHHPNLVRLGELFEQGGQWFFTMDLVDGVPLLDWVRTEQPLPPAPLGPHEDDVPTLPHESEDSEDEPKVMSSMPVGYDENRLRSAFAQLAAGLFALHQAHKVHRDIKPSNVLVTRDGEVKILDFGLVTEAAHKRLWPDDHLVGTVSYMAPEQAAQKPVGPAADWYSMGVVLYQALTGKLPVRGTTQEVLVLKQAVEPVAPHALAAVPADLDALCMDLLKIDPATRPQGSEVLRRLAVEADSGRPSGAFFVGRRREIGVLREAFLAARAGQRVAVFVHGESGVGKSALALRFAEAMRAEHPGTVLLTGRCYERESVPYKAVDGAIDSVSRYMTTLQPAAAASLLPDHAGLLGQVFPVMRRIENVARSPRVPLDKLDPMVLRTRLFAMVRELFIKLAKSTPLVVVIDDLQWADADSFALLGEVLRSPDAPPFLLVATVRAASKEEPGFQKVSDLGARIGGDVRTVHVAPLPPDDARTLARSLIEGTSVDTGPDALTIADAAGGHPLFIDELVRQRRLRKDGSGPLRLDEALYTRVSTLEPAVRYVLAIVVLAGTPMEQETAARAAEMDFGALSRIVTILRAQNLVRTGGVRRSDLVEPYHDRIREAVVDRLEPAQKKKLHGRLAIALQASDRADLETLSIHFDGSGDLDRAAEYAIRAADEATSAFAFDRAARLYQRALELRPRDGAEGARLYEKLGDALANTGRGADAAKAYVTAVQWAPPEHVLDLRRRVAEQLLRSGLFDEGVEQLGIVLAAIGMEMPKTPGRALASLLFRRAQVRLRGIAFHERAAPEIPPDALEHADVCWSAAVALGMVDNIRGAYFQARGLLLALQAGEPYRVARALAVESIFAATPGGDGKERAELLLAAAKECAQKVGQPFVLAWCELADGIAAYVMGEFRRSYESSVRARKLFDGCTGVAWERETADFYGILSSFYLGRMRDQAKRVERSRREADERGDLIASTYVRSGLAVVPWLSRDEPAGARSEVDDTMRRWSQRGYFFSHFWCLLANANIDLYVGDVAKAYDRLEAEWSALDDSLLPRSVQIVRIESLHARARAALALAAATPDRQGELLRRADKDARQLEREGMAYSVPLGQLVHAGVACLRDDDAGAGSLLDEAIKGFEAADMQLYAAAARHRRGALTGNRDVVEAAEEWMRREEIRAPESMLGMLAPGFRGAKA